MSSVRVLGQLLKTTTVEYHHFTLQLSDRFIVYELFPLMGPFIIVRSSPISRIILDSTSCLSTVLLRIHVLSEQATRHRSSQAVHYTKTSTPIISNNHVVHVRHSRKPSRIPLPHPLRLFLLNQPTLHPCRLPVAPPGPQSHPLPTHASLPVQRSLDHRHLPLRYFLPRAHHPRRIVLPAQFREDRDQIPLEMCRDGESCCKWGFWRW